MKDNMEIKIFTQSGGAPIEVIRLVRVPEMVQ
jgi:hypothetical protein